MALSLSLQVCGYNQWKESNTWGVGHEVSCLCRSSRNLSALDNVSFN